MERMDTLTKQSFGTKNLNQTHNQHQTTLVQSQRVEIEKGSLPFQPLGDSEPG